MDAGTWIFTLTVAAGTITQSPPTTATTTASASYSSQLVTAGVSGTETFTETTNLPNSAAVLVSSTGAITTSGTLAAGSYAVSGTDSDTDGDAGTWTFTLTVSPTGSAGSHSSSCAGGFDEFTEWDVVQLDEHGYGHQ